MEITQMSYQNRLQRASFNDNEVITETLYRIIPFKKRDIIYRISPVYHISFDLTITFLI